jgi:hypothetical protein
MCCESNDSPYRKRRTMRARICAVRYTMQPLPHGMRARAWEAEGLEKRQTYILLSNRHTYSLRVKKNSRFSLRLPDPPTWHSLKPKHPPPPHYIMLCAYAACIHVGMVCTYMIIIYICVLYVFICNGLWQLFIDRLNCWLWEESGEADSGERGATASPPPPHPKWKAIIL